MLADITAFESLQTTTNSAAVPMFHFKPDVAACLLESLNAEAESFIATMQAGLNCFEKHDSDFRLRFITAMEYARSEDSPRARDLAAKALAVQARLGAEKERCSEAIRNRKLKPK